MTITFEELHTSQKDACESITVGGGQYWGLKVKKERPPISLQKLIYYSYLFWEVSKAVREMKNKAIKITKDTLA